MTEAPTLGYYPDPCECYAKVTHPQRGVIAEWHTCDEARQIAQLAASALDLVVVERETLREELVDVVLGASVDERVAIADATLARLTEQQP